MAKKENITPSVQEGELGKLLEEYREIAGYSLSQMADALCLSEAVLVNLEGEQFETLAQPPYIRGYLRNYAKIAAQEPDNLINLYESLRGADPKELELHFKKSSVVHTQQQKSLSPILIQVFFLALLLGIIAGIIMIPSVNSWIKSTWESFSDQASTSSIENTDNPLLTGTMPVPTSLSLPIPETKKIIPETLDDNTKPINSTKEASKNTNTQEIENDNGKSKENTKLETNQETNQETTKVELTTNVEVTKKPEKTSDSNKNSKTINIKLAFQEDVWIRIKDGNKKTIFEGLNPKGKTKTLDLKKPLIFRVGNAQALTLSVDGKLVDLSTYIKGSVANFTLE